MGSIIVPFAVTEELEIGRRDGVNVPDPAVFDWVTVLRCRDASRLPMVEDLGAGEAEALALALEIPESKVIMDDKLGRLVAQELEIPFIGTLGILLNAKQQGLIDLVEPLLVRLAELGFFLSERTRKAVLELAGE